jgi:serine/threonine-protein kinase ATR
VLHLDSVDSSMIFYDDDGSPNVSIQSTYAVQGQTTGIWHVINLLSMLVDIAMESASSHHATPAFRDYLAWMLESFFAANELQKRLRQDTKFQEFCKKSEIMGFCAVHALLSVLRESLSDAILRKGYILLSFLCADLLEAPSEITEKSIRLSLCSSLLNLATVSKQYDSVRRAISLHLIPVVHSTLRDASAVSTLGKDFQVSSLQASYS